MFPCKKIISHIFLKMKKNVWIALLKKIHDNIKISKLKGKF